MATKTPAKSSRKPAPAIVAAQLRQWNKWIAAAFAVQAVVILILSATRLLPVTVSYPGLDTLQTQAQGHTVLATGSQRLFDINLAFVVAAFLLIAAIAHGLLSTKLRAQYERELKRGVNTVRWLEYGISGGIMMAAIGLVIGVRDLVTLILMFGLTAVMYLLGWIMETQNQGAGRVNWLIYIIGCTAGALAWVVPTIYLISGAVYGYAGPTYTYLVYGSMLVLFAGFMINLYMQSKKTGNWANYLYAERMYMLLSILTKTILAWLIFAGTLRP